MAHLIPFVYIIYLYIFVYLPTDRDFQDLRTSYKHLQVAQHSFGRHTWACQASCRRMCEA